MDSESSQPHFQHFVAIIFNNWTALKLALEHGMGGPPTISDAKVVQMIESVSSLISSGKEWENIADTLLDIMDSDFSTVVEDNSSDEIAFQLCQLYQMYSSGNLQEITAYMSHLPEMTPITSREQVRRSTQRHAEEETDPPHCSNQAMQSEEDPEWTVVKRR